MLLWEQEAALLPQQTGRCCEGWAVLRAAARPHWSGARRFPGAGSMRLRLQHAAVRRVNTLALPQLPALPERLNSCLGLAGAGLQPKAISLPAPRLSISFSFPKVAAGIPCCSILPLTGV